MLNLNPSLRSLFDLDLPMKHRKHIRLPGYDYSTPGAYFVTICTRLFQCLFGQVSNGIIDLNNLGRLAHDCWTSIPDHYPTVAVDVFQIMPNHLHGILLFEEDGSSQRISPSLGNVIGSYKSAVTRQIHALPGHSKILIWEANYYEHIVRNEDSLQKIRHYIVNNPLRWELDTYNPRRLAENKTDDWLDVLDDLE